MFFDLLFDLLYGFLFIVATILAVSIGCRFHREVVTKTSWYAELEHHLVHRWDAKGFRRMGKLGMFFVDLLIGVILGVISPVLWFVLNYREDKECKRQKEQDRLSKEDLRLRRSERNAENERRAELRKQWLMENTVTLYFKTMGGITAVLRPADYEYIKGETEAARQDERWKNTGVLLPSSRTFVFVTTQGKGLMDTAFDLYSISGCKVSWISKLYGQVMDEKKGKVELIHAADIFVPGVNEALVPFEEQKSIIQGGQDQHLYRAMVETQVPPEMQELPSI